MNDRHLKLKDAIEVVRHTVEDKYIESTLELRLLDKSFIADVRENAKGEWIRWYEEIKHDGYTEYIPHCKCPKCETEYDSHTVKFINFCPNCGTDMRTAKQIVHDAIDNTPMAEDIFIGIKEKLHKAVEEA